MSNSALMEKGLEQQREQHYLLCMKHIRKKDKKQISEVFRYLYNVTFYLMQCRNYIDGSYILCLTTFCFMKFYVSSIHTFNKRRDSLFFHFPPIFILRKCS